VPPSLEASGVPYRLRQASFGLAGLEGFLHHFAVTIRAYDGYLDIEPQP
jgi:hypothetical protein